MEINKHRQRLKELLLTNSKSLHPN